MAWLEKNIGNKNGISTGGVGYVVIPENVEDIGAYINNCYRTNQVTISGDGYGVMSQVKVTDQVMPHINFPDDKMSVKGSLVVWVRESFYNRPIVVGILSNNDTPNLQIGGQKSQRQDYQGVSIEFLQDAINAIAQVYACGSRVRPAKIIIKSAGSDEDSIELTATGNIKAGSKTFNLEVTDSFVITIDNGEKEVFNIKADEDRISLKDYNNNEIVVTEIDDDEQELKKSIEIRDMFGREYLFDSEKAEIKDQFGHSLVLDNEKAYYKDEHGNEATFNEENTQFKCNKFNVGSGKEHMVLGDTLKDLLSQILDAIKNITVTTPHGISSKPINSGQFSEIQSKLDTILSKLSNTD